MKLRDKISSGYKPIIRKVRKLNEYFTLSVEQLSYLIMVQVHGTKIMLLAIPSVIYYVYSIDGISFVSFLKMVGLYIYVIVLWLATIYQIRS